MVNNRDINIDQNNRDNHFGNNRAALVELALKLTFPVFKYITQYVYMHSLIRLRP